MIALFLGSHNNITEDEHFEREVFFKRVKTAYVSFKFTKKKKNWKALGCMTTIDYYILNVLKIGTSYKCQANQSLLGQDTHFLDNSLCYSVLCLQGYRSRKTVFATLFHCNGLQCCTWIKTRSPILTGALVSRHFVRCSSVGKYSRDHSAQKCCFICVRCCHFDNREVSRIGTINLRKRQ